MKKTLAVILSLIMTLSLGVAAGVSASAAADITITFKDGHGFYGDFSVDIQVDPDAVTWYDCLDLLAEEVDGFYWDDIQLNVETEDYPFGLAVDDLDATVSASGYTDDITVFVWYYKNSGTVTFVDNDENYIGDIEISWDATWLDALLALSVKLGGSVLPYDALYYGDIWGDAGWIWIENFEDLTKPIYISDLIWDFTVKVVYYQNFINVTFVDGDKAELAVFNVDGNHTTWKDMFFMLFEALDLEAGDYNVKEITVLAPWDGDDVPVVDVDRTLTADDYTIDITVKIVFEEIDIPDPPLTFWERFIAFFRAIIDFILNLFPWINP
ncbi:MAG: hypothetical protein FWF08_07660 [Oscillospiraceae bacterium]|nr:hypothetical protein [Oscillospiraceae bacterium]